MHRTSLLTTFQSTHPVRGATIPPPLRRLATTNFNPRTPCGVRLDTAEIRLTVCRISIHAPRAGCDGVGGIEARLPPGFQSTHPVRGATPVIDTRRAAGTISIHAPRAGCDVGGIEARLPPGISIHAPRVGCDQSKLARLKVIREFQSTHPVWGATFYSVKGDKRCMRFQSTHPVWGATTTTTRNKIIGGHFNPRTPCGVRLWGILITSISTKISIHAPRVGCDVSATVSRFCSALHFNPRTPCGVRPGRRASPL